MTFADLLAAMITSSASPKRPAGSSAAASMLRNVYSEEEERREGIALVVIAGRRQGLTTLRDDLAEAAPDLTVMVAGDALSPRTLLDAVAESARAGATRRP